MPETDRLGDSDSIQEATRRDYMISVQIIEWPNATIQGFACKIC